MGRAHVGQGWRIISFPTNAHVAEVERQISARLGGASRSAIIALAVSGFQIEDYTAYREHLHDYGVLVAPQGKLTSIHLTDETEADLQALGAAFEQRKWLQLLKGTTGYNRRMLIYVALRWYNEHLTASEQMC